MIKTTVTKQWKGNEVKIQGKKVVGKTAFEIGLVVEGQAKLLAAKKSGYLAASITTQTGTGEGTEPGNPSSYGSGIAEDGEGFSSSEMTIQAPEDENEVLVGTPLFYAPHVEFGTVRQNAQSFLRPSLALAQGKTLTICLKEAKYYFKEYIKQ